MPTMIYHYPNCSTCKKALKWLAARDIAAEQVDIVKSPPTAGQLREMWQASGLPLKKFFNTAGQSYRNGGFKDRLPHMSDDEQLAALAADGKLIKRPLLRRTDGGSETVLVGFKDAAYAEAFEG